MKILDALKVLFSRSLILFVILGALAGLLINRDKLHIGEKARLAQFQRPWTYKELVEYLETDAKIPTKKVEEWLKYYRLYLDKNPQSADAWMMVGFCEYQLGHDEKAYEAFLQSSQYGPKNFWPYYNLGFMDFKQKKYDQALKWLHQAVNLTPEESFRLVKESKYIYIPIVGAADLSSSDLKRQIKSGYRDAFLMIVFIYSELKDYPSVLKYAQFGKFSNLGYPALFYFYQGLSFYHLNEYERAVDVFQRSIAENKGLSQTYHYLALSYQKLGKEDKAQEQFKQEQAIAAMTEGLNSHLSSITVRIF